MHSLQQSFSCVSYILGLCCCSLIFLVKAETIIERKLSLGSTVHITSPGFPSCCGNGAVVINLTLSPPHDDFYIIFTDLDIPKYSIFQIYEEEDLVPQQPWYDEDTGIWKSHVYHSTRGHLRVVFNPVLDPGAKHVGFRLRADAYEDSVLKRTSTDCPVLTDTYKGGVIKIAYRNFGSKSKLECFWVMKPSVYSMGVFLWFNSSKYRKVVSVHLGNSSDGREISPVNMGHAVVFSTDNGSLYVQMELSRNLDTLTTFTFGSMQVKNNTATKTKKECYIGEQNHKGLICQTSSNHSDWCVPFHHRCDQMELCPLHEDELNCVFTTVKPTLATTLVPSCGLLRKRCRDKCIPYSMYCGDTVIDVSCTARKGKKKCKDGRCIWIYQECCRQKECFGGSCVDYGQRCSGESCYDIGRQSCQSSDQCFEDYQRCNGLNECIDHSDEENCISTSHKLCKFE